MIQPAAIARQRVPEWRRHLHRHRDVGPSRAHRLTHVGGCVHYFCAGRHVWTLIAPGASPSVMVTSRLAGTYVTV